MSNLVKRIVVAGAALNQTPMDWKGNRENIEHAIRAARQAGAQVLCLPEMCICGYGCEDMYLSASLVERCFSELEGLLSHCSGMAVCFGLPLIFSNAVFNVVALAVDGRLVGMTAKQNLAGDGVYYEPRWFKGWPSGTVAEYKRGSLKLPLGDVYFNLSGIKLGFEICEDAWAARRTGVELSARGVDLILNPSASHFAFGKHEVRERFVCEGSRAFGVSYVYSNLLGCESGRLIYDGDVLIASEGNIVARTERFAFSNFTIASATVDLEQTRMSRARSASFRPQIRADAPGEVQAELDFENKKPRKAPRDAQHPHQDWSEGKFSKHEEFARAIALGLFDYLRKSRSQGFVVSLSGGVDSSAVSVLVSSMIILALNQLGLEGLKSKLSHISNFPAEASAKIWCQRLLTCVYQATCNSSGATREAARGVAQALGASYLELEVDALFKSYVELVGRATSQELTWDRNDLELQNVQARVRGPGVWLVANLRKALLLTTSNRSEAAVGYATMDGDTCGGLAPISGVDKAFLREWLCWFEKHGPLGIGALPALRAVNVQEPTAELRPAEFKQTDESDLMPYRVLDPIERYAIRDKKDPIQVYELIKSDFGAEFDEQQLGRWVERFFRLWAVNQWKRERYAPGFHLDDENLDPKTWCRFPILSGNFEAELHDLRAYLKRGSGRLRLVKSARGRKRG